MLKIHFLNVGHGDCVIVEFKDNNRVAMIDINRSEEMDEQSKNEVYSSLKSTSSFLSEQGLLSINRALLEKAGYDVALQDPISYIEDNNIRSIFRFISSHPHMDHLTGLCDLKDRVGFSNIWIVDNTYKQDYTKLSESQKKDWNLYKSYRDTGENQVDGVTIIRPEEGSSAQFYREDGIYLLAPNDDLKYEVENNANKMSYVLLIKHKGRKILLPGDAEKATWEYLVENYNEDIKDIDILKAAHHGRDSGYHQPAVKLMSPVVTIVSVGKKPSTDSTNKYKQYCENVWSTRWKGNIILEIDDKGKMTYSTQYDR
jgi:beta-lactamase superfamily II metal-dependent hydrolase